MACTRESEDSDVSSSCQLAGTLLEVAVAQGARTLNALGLEKLSANEVTKIQDTVGHKTWRRNWRCVSNEHKYEQKGHHCEFVVRAKRLNVFADAIELVWFDGKEEKNPAYGLWVATHRNPDDDPKAAPRFDKKQVAKLCAAEPTSTRSFRSYASVDLAQASSTADCVQPVATGGGGCSAAGFRPTEASLPALLAGLILLAMRSRAPYRKGAVKARSLERTL